MLGKPELVACVSAALAGAGESPAFEAVLKSALRQLAR